MPRLQKKKKAQKKAHAQSSTVPETVEEKKPVAKAVSAQKPNTDDTELIAVIAAAIAADTGTSTNDFVVRSINRR